MDLCWSTTPPPHAREHVPVVDQEFKTQFCRRHDLRRRRRPPSPWTREVNYRRPRRKNNKTYPKIFSHGAQEREVYQAMAKVKVATKIVLELINTGFYHVLFCKLRYHCCQIVVRWINHVKYCFRFPKLWRKILTPLLGETAMSRFFFFLGGGGEARTSCNCSARALNL